MENSTVTLETFDHVARLVVSCGRNALIAKAGIEQAYRIIPMGPLDYPKLGFSWKDQFYFERVLVMDASSSVRIFVSFSKSIQWILQTKFCVKHVSHIINDIIFVGKANSSECIESGRILCKHISIPIKEKKTIFPTKWH